MQQNAFSDSTPEFLECLFVLQVFDDFLEFQFDFFGAIKIFKRLVVVDDFGELVYRPEFLWHQNPRRNCCRHQGDC